MTPPPSHQSLGLVNVPPPHMDESVSSWVSRLTVLQGATLKEVLGLLQLNERTLDRDVTGTALDALRKKCGLSVESFSWHDKVLSALKSIDGTDIPLLRQTPMGRPLVSFCPLCLLEMRTPYMPIHWRFEIWQWCPIHDTPMRGHCPECHYQPSVPVDVRESPCGRKGYLNLNRCMKCGARLDRVRTGKLGKISLDQLSNNHQRQLKNGRALLAALYHGHFSLHPGSRTKPIETLDAFLSAKDFPAPRSLKRLRGVFL